ncbi:MAG TPA: hypothetical protein VI565_11565 [Burkholderiales bacterium]|nr:hypothetical protein [Burkholderiales bacterium]
METIQSPAVATGPSCACGAQFPPTLLGAWSAKEHAEGSAHTLLPMGAQAA